ncbi:MAG: SDR family NAD(P)-dependent oxidoreductase [Gemmatimonadaceae bacterium]|nr:SDR family NAD(P)-dependent oxidoreductase [Gemmatimonadaceae bacterium]
MTSRPLAVITGASRGIGAALARRCIDEGMQVALIARTAVPLREYARSLGAAAQAFPCDLTDASAVRAAAEAITTSFGVAPDALVNNAGLFQIAAVDTMSPADFAAVVQVNLVAPFLLTRALLPAMRARGRGTVVTLGSIADRTVFAGNGAYAASKYGLRALHEAMRQELRGSGVRATLVSPGPVDTSLWDPIDPDNQAGFTPRAAMLPATAVADAIWYALSRPADVNIDELRLSRS